MSKTDRSPSQKSKQRVYLEIPEHLTLYVGINAGGEVLEAYASDDPDRPDGWEPRTLEFVRDFVRRFVLADQSWGKEMDRIYMAMDLRSTFHGRVPGDVVELSKDEHEAICEVVRKPGKGYSPALAIHFVPWFQAVLEASDKRPSRDDGVEVHEPS